MRVKLVAITKPLVGDGNLTASDFITFAARVSNPSNQMSLLTAPKLLAYCIKHGHWSIFEQASMTVEIQTSRAISAQIIRHRSFCFQEFCVAGDTRITLELPNGAKRGKRSAYSRTIEHLYRLQQRGAKMPSNIRVFDEATKTFVNTQIAEVFQTGVKPLFRITLENGNTIEATKEHKFLTSKGFKSIEDAVGLFISGKTATWKNSDVEIGCNGVPAYQDRQWLLDAKLKSIESKLGLNGIAEDAGTSTHTIRKWLKRHGLQFTKREVSLFTPVWNKGIKWSRGSHSIETIFKMRASARKGSASNLWKGGVSRAERLSVADWCNANRSEFLIKFSHRCNRCGGSKMLELHHIVPVSENPSLAREKSNIEVLCKRCHAEHHRILGHAKSWREKHSGNTLTVHWSKIKSIEFVGEKMTYDLEVKHSSHNYVANGIVTHNSQRYAPTDTAELVELRTQDRVNRQGSGEVYPQEWANEVVAKSVDLAFRTYRTLINEGVSRETARMVLPLCTQTTLYMTGNIRSWIHYFEQRCAKGTQKEHRDIAIAIRDTIFAVEFSHIHAALQEAK
jgi:thymidylate synthase (FAD)